MVGSLIGSLFVTFQSYKNVKSCKGPAKVLLFEYIGLVDTLSKPIK